MADPVRVQVIQAGPDAVRADELAAVRDRKQPGAGGDPERRGELRWLAPALVIAEPEADDATPCVPRRQPGQRAGLKRMLRPVGRDDDPEPDPRGGGRLRGRVKHK